MKYLDECMQILIGFFCCQNDYLVTICSIKLTLMNALVVVVDTHEYDEYRVTIVGLGVSICLQQTVLTKKSIRAKAAHKIQLACNTVH